MRYADPHVCPDCRTHIAGQTRCPSCALDLGAPALARVWAGLLAVDTALAEARSQSAAAQAPAPAPLAATPAAPPAPAQAPASATAHGTPRQVNVGSVLLALGALFVLVAGAIFVAVAWGALGILGRAVVLLAFTALVGAIASVVTRRGLRASAEALWGVFLGLLTLDWFAAHAQGLASLDRLPWGLHTMLWGGVAVAASLSVVVHARRHLTITLVVPSVVAGLAAWAAGLGAVGWYDEVVGHQDRLAWGAVAAVAVAGVITIVLHRAGNHLGRQIGIAACVTFGGAATGLAVIDALAHSSLGDLTVRAHGLPLLLAAVGSLAVAAVLDRLRSALTAVAVAELALLLVVPAQHAWPEQGAYLVGASVLVALVAVATEAGGWWRGVRIAAATIAAVLCVGALPWLARSVDVALTAEPGDLDPTARIRTAAEWSGDAWLVAVVGLALTLATLLTGRWPEPAAAPRYAPPATALMAGAFLPLVAAAADPTVLSMAASVLGAGALAVFAARTSPSASWEWVPVLVLAAAAVTALGSWWACVIVWPAAAAMLVLLAVLGRGAAWRALAAGGAALVGLGTVLPLTSALEIAARPASLAAVITGVAGLVLATRVSRAPERVGAEVGAGGVALLGLVVGTDTSLAWMALLSTVAGAAIALIGVVDEQRRVFRWVGTGLLGLAWVLRLLASDVDVVEAYTAPFAAALLAAGVLGLWRRRDLGSAPALSAGLTLALLPSLPLVLDDPTSLRPLLLGLFAAGCTAAGVVLRWRAPFVGGVATLAVIAVVELGPYAMAIPRWTLMALVGSVLLGVGITWEQRVRDGRAAVRYVDAMR